MSKRVVVVGASSGLGRCLGVGLAKRGARVALFARREQLIRSAAEEAGGDAFAVQCDVTDRSSCDAAFDAAAANLGGIDAVIYAAGMGVLSRITDLDSSIWHRVFDTNVVGAWQATASALPYLTETSGTVAYLTSVSASMTAPWPGLASYTVTKAALDKLVEAWRAEHPHVGFTRLIVGECAGEPGPGSSQFMANFDMDLLGELFPVWLERGLVTDKLMDINDFVDSVDGLLRCGASTALPSVALTPRRPI